MIGTVCIYVIYEIYVDLMLTKTAFLSGCRTQYRQRTLLSKKTIF